MPIVSQAIQITSVDQITSAVLTQIQTSEETVKLAKVTITADQIKACFTTPVEIIAAPGVGKVIMIDEVMVMNQPGNNYLNVGGNHRIRYDGGTTDAVAAVINNLLIAQDDNYIQKIDGIAMASQSNAAYLNKSIKFLNDTQNMTVGTRPLKLSIRYRVITI